jgi:hypothetical protein
MEVLGVKGCQQRTPNDGWARDDGGAANVGWQHQQWFLSPKRRWAGNFSNPWEEPEGWQPVWADDVGSEKS